MHGLMYIENVYSCLRFYFYSNNFILKPGDVQKGAETCSFRIIIIIKYTALLDGDVTVYTYIHIFVVPCIIILGRRKPTRCNNMQIFIYC